MNKLKTIDHHKLQKNEFMGLHKNFVTFAKGIEGVTELAASLLAYRNAVETLNKHLKVSVDESQASIASRLNNDRIAAYVNLRKVVNALVVLENAELSAIGKTYTAIFDGYDNPRDIKQRSATNVIDMVIADLRARPKEELASSGIENWLAQLESKQSAFVNANTARDEERDSRIDSATAMYRNECVEKYKILANHAYALAESNGNEACISFIEQVNGEIAMCKEKLKMQKTIATKKKASETVAADGKAETNVAETAKVETVATESVSSETAIAEVAKDAA